MMKHFRPDPPDELIRRGYAASGTGTKKELAFFIYNWFSTHPNIPRPERSAAGRALEIYLSYVEPRK